MDRQRKVSLVVVIAFIALCVAWFAGGHEAYKKHRAEAYVRTLLNDPESALFRYVHAGPNGVCGEVKGRNALGGYGEWRQFWASSDGAIGAIEPDLPDRFSEAPPAEVALIEHYRSGYQRHCAG